MASNRFTCMGRAAHSVGFSGLLSIIRRIPPGIGHDPQKREGSAKHRAPPTNASSQAEGGGSYRAAPPLPLALRVPALSPWPAPPWPPSLPYGKRGRSSDGKTPPRGAFMLPTGSPKGQWVWAGPGRQALLPAPGGGAAGQAMGRRCRVSHDRCSCRVEGEGGHLGGGGFAKAAEGGIVALAQEGACWGGCMWGERRGRLCQPSSLGLLAIPEA